MRKLLLVYICFVCFLESKGQENEMYFVTAPTGLVVRDQPGLKSKRTGKLPYGSTVTVLKKTDLTQSVIDGKDRVLGFWVKIRFENFPFIVSESEAAYGYDGEGYVFNGYLDRLSKASVKIDEIDSLKFNALFIKPKPSHLAKITSNEDIRQQLASKVKWKEVEDLGWTIDKIILDDRQTLSINQKSNDYDLVAYYPSEEILLFEGGHNSDYSISIETGETLKTVGNPEYIVESPNKKFRLNGWFPGQECSQYFFQEKNGSSYTYLVDFGWGNEKFGKDVCNFNKFSWVNDGKFVYSHTDYSSGIEKEKFFIGEINK